MVSVIDPTETVRAEHECFKPLLMALPPVADCSGAASALCVEISEDEVDNTPGSNTIFVATDSQTYCLVIAMQRSL